MQRACLVLFAAALAFGQGNTLSPKEAAEGWIMLFDGESLFGWTPDGEAKWSVADGAIVAEGGPGVLNTNSVFADYVVRWEFRTNADGKWHTQEIQAGGHQFVYKRDGRQTRRVTQKPGEAPLARHIGLRHEKARRSEFRNARLKPLGLKPIFNGKDLSGWQVVEPPKPPKEPAQWTVKDGMIHVEKGGGQLETENLYDDFILQLDIRTNAQNEKHHPNSGVFLRGEPKGYWSGYESQIRNEYKDSDRTQAVDYGTGGIYRNQPARKVVGNDNEFFTKTIVARGRRLAVWVNGYPVSDWEDPNPEGTDVRKKQAKLGAGTISLQAHDPTTNLDFKNIRIARLPKEPAASR